MLDNNIIMRSNVSEAVGKSTTNGKVPSSHSQSMSSRKG